MGIREFLKTWPPLRGIYRRLNNQIERDEFVIAELGKLPAQGKILDAGCGSQRYRQNCSHLSYKSQDFGQYTTDDKKMLGSEGVGGTAGYRYGSLDYTCDIWDIPESDHAFDSILCTEVFEHIPFPIETLKEFSRLLKPGGTLILTAPSNCLRHMDPYFFYTGFSDRWYERFLVESGFEVRSIAAVGDYYSWLAVEMARTAVSHSILAKILLLPAFLYFFLKNKTRESENTLCMGYHVVAIKR